KKRGEKLGENCTKLLKTNAEQMSAYRLLAILMKTNELKSFSGDVDEKKEERRWMQGKAVTSFEGCSHVVCGQVRGIPSGGEADFKEGKGRSFVGARDENPARRIGKGKNGP